MCNCKYNGSGREEEFLLNENETSSEWELLPELESEFQGAVSNPAEEGGLKMLQARQEKISVAFSIAQGKTNENDLTNQVFFSRHPELKKQPLRRGQPGFDNLSKEWLEIREHTVRPMLKALKNSSASAGTPSSASTLPPGSSSDQNMPPAEGPVKGITGYKCPSGKKCWRGAKSADIIDGDAPWNKPGKRSAANYIAVLDYFNPGEDDSKGLGNTINKPSENPRYRQQKNEKGHQSTYCNIYVHDVTRAMWASIPHWVKSSRTNKWNELNANDTVDWLMKNGATIGWYPVQILAGWIQQQYQSKQSASTTLNLPAGIIQAARLIATSYHDNPSLLIQTSYLAQKFANLGFPTTAVWKHGGGIGHVAMIRPEEESKKGKLVSGVFIPRSAQAGSKNFNSNYLVFRPGTVKSGAVQFYVHE